MISRLKRKKKQKTHAWLEGRLWHLERTPACGGDSLAPRLDPCSSGAGGIWSLLPVWGCREGSSARREQGGGKGGRDCRVCRKSQCERGRGGERYGGGL